MNRIIPRIGAGIVTAAVFLFAVCLLIDFSFGSYLVCMLLPIGYIMLTAGFYCECEEDRRAAAVVGMAFSAIYAVLILLVYFAQVTNVRLDDMTEQAVMILDFKRGGLIFSYDLLGYGMMALSTFFILVIALSQHSPRCWKQPRRRQAWGKAGKARSGG